MKKSMLLVVTVLISISVFAQKVKNEEGESNWDVVIADTKLSEKTGFTDNQKKAMGLGSFYVKAYNSDFDITGNKIELKATDKVFRSIIKDKFIKIYSNGGGIYQGVK
ncbi:MAG: hypothetical protein K2X95_01900 [Flavobacteriaceae bacterium]|nr:hypothetical protein [Flavobacteriaceae bacterium]